MKPVLETFWHIMTRRGDGRKTPCRALARAFRQAAFVCLAIGGGFLSSTALQAGPLEEFQEACATATAADTTDFAAYFASKGFTTIDETSLDEEQLFEFGASLLVNLAPRLSEERDTDYWATRAIDTAEERVGFFNVVEYKERNWRTMFFYYFEPTIPKLDCLAFGSVEDEAEWLGTAIAQDRLDLERWLDSNSIALAKFGEIRSANDGASPISYAILGSWDTQVYQSLFGQKPLYSLFLSSANSRLKP